jgi:hypothetical protein
VGALHDSLQGRTPQERQALIASAWAALPQQPRSVTLRGHTATVTSPLTDMGGYVEFRLSITRTSDGADVTPPLLNPVRVVNPRYAMPDAGGDIVESWTDPEGTVHTDRYREDVAASLLSLMRDLLGDIGR